MRQRLSYANVMSTLAVFVVLGGGAYAASKVGSNDIARNAVKSKHVGPNALSGSDIKEATLRGAPPVAYAHVVDSETIPARSSGVRVLTDSFSGLYCLRVNGNPKNVQVTAEREGNGSTVVGSATFDTDEPPFDENCPGNANVAIEFQDLLQSFVNTDFFVVFH